MTTVALPLMSDDDLQRANAARGEEEGFGALSTEKGNLPLVALDVRAQITGLLAQVTLTQTFANPFDQRLEATYIFPLPSRGALTRLQLQIAERTIDGVLKERGEAREIYDQAITDGHRAAIAEEERPGVFTLRVGNLDAHERATVTLNLTVPLTYEDGEATFRFPLVVSPRYIPGRPLNDQDVGSGIAHDTDRVPDASRISPPILLPGFPNPIQLGIEVELDPAGLEVGQLCSSLHAVTHSERSGGRTHVKIHPGERVNRDFILRFPVAPSGISTGLVRARDEKGETFALTLVPPADLASTVRRREVVFVLDRSGSMSGWKMVAARRALGRMVDSLNGEDSFTVLTFDHEVQVLPPLLGTALARATDRARFMAVENLGRVEARGGTELREPMLQAISLLNSESGGGDRILVLVTDGAVGNEDELLASLAPRLKSVRVFTVGVDQAVNEGFLRRLAALGGGSCELLESEDRLDAAMDRIHRRIATPVLEGLRIEFENATPEADTMVPARLPALFVGSPLTVTGRLTGVTPGAEVHARVTATDALGQPWSTRVSARMVDSAAPGVTWARGALRTLEDRYLLEPSSALEQRIVSLSLDHGVLCRFTAFVAVDRSEKVEIKKPLHQVTQAVELPDGWMPMSAPASAGTPPQARERSKRLLGGLMASIGGAGVGRQAAPPRMARKEMPDEAPQELDVAPLELDDETPFEDSASAGQTIETAPIPGFGQDALAPLDSMQAPVLRAYRQRASVLVSQLEAKPDLVGLRATWMALKTLIEDLVSIAPESDELPALRSLMLGLQAELMREPRDVQALVAALVAGLKAFADGADEVRTGETSEPKPRKSFWRLPF